MGYVENQSGWPPTLRKAMRNLWDAVGGALIVTIDTADDTPAPTSAVWTKTIHFRITDAAGVTVECFDGYNIAATVGDTSTAGTAAVDDATPAITGGKGTVVLSGDAQDWLNSETATVTFSSTTAGYDLANAVFTRTFTTP